MFISHYFEFDQILKKKKKKKKNTFPKDFFNEFWLIIREYKYIYIAAIKQRMEIFIPG